MSDMDIVEDMVEWEETLDLLVEGHETVGSELSFGNYVTLKDGLFQKMIKEINDFRMKNGDLKDGIELIIVDEGRDDEVNEVDSEC